MTDAAKSYARIAWCVLGWNVFVVLWGAFVRASNSGAGCGDHWPLCNGTVVPMAPTIHTIIEFTHRVTSGLALVGVAWLALAARSRFPKNHVVRSYAWAAVVLILIEALLGAGLVLLRYVGKNASFGRAAYLCLHLTNTLLLLGAILCVAWFATRARASWSQTPRMIGWAMGVALLACLTGAIAALGDTIWPASTLAGGMRDEFAAAAPMLLRLRLVHPVVAGAAGFFLTLAALMTLRGTTKTWVLALTGVQVAAGVVNVLLLAPVWMQILHLGLGVAVWLWLVVGALEGSTAKPAALQASGD